MPYKDRTSAAAQASQKRRAQRYREKHYEEIVARERRWRESHIDQVRAKSLRWYYANREKSIERSRLTGLRLRYGLTPEQYEALGSVCEICESTHDNTSYRRRLHVDHVKDTKIVRGMLCGRCNTGIAKFNHDVTLLRNAITYLERTALQPAFVGT